MAHTANGKLYRREQHELSRKTPHRAHYCAQGEGNGKQSTYFAIHLYIHASTGVIHPFILWFLCPTHQPAYCGHINVNTFRLVYNPGSIRKGFDSVGPMDRTGSEGRRRYTGKFAYFDRRGGWCEARTTTGQKVSHWELYWYFCYRVRFNCIVISSAWARGDAHEGDVFSE